MARPYRLEAEECLYHIMSRGNDKRDIFSEDKDYQKFLSYTEKAKEKYQFFLYAYVLMPNHYHLLLETTLPNLSKIMHFINGSYTTYNNIKHQRVGHLFQGRYKSIIIDKDNYLAELTRYIHLNPLRAQMCENPEDYNWSSYREYLGLNKTELINKENLKDYTDLNKRKYKSFVMNAIGKEKNLFSNVYGGILLGSAEFIEKTLKNAKNLIGEKEISYKRALHTSLEIDEIVSVVSAKLKTDKKSLYNKCNCQREERKIAIYIAKRLTEKSNREIGAAFGISYTAVSKIAKSIEQNLVENKKLKKIINKLISRFKG
ncbi:transposase [Chlamydiota bacterium]